MNKKIVIPIFGVLLISFVCMISALYYTQASCRIRITSIKIDDDGRCNIVYEKVLFNSTKYAFRQGVNGKGKIQMICSNARFPSLPVCGTSTMDFPIDPEGEYITSDRPMANKLISKRILIDVGSTYWITAGKPLLIYQCVDKSGIRYDAQFEILDY